jgi:hypothetical protein
VRDDRQAALMRSADDGVERATIEHHSGIGVHDDLDDGCPERELLSDRRLRGARQRPARVADVLVHLVDAALRRPRPADGVAAARREEGTGERDVRQPIVVAAGRHEVERCAEIDDPGQ